MEIKIFRLNNIEGEKLTEGIQRKAVFSEKATFAQFNIKKGTHVPTHNHVSEQITYVIKGKMRFKIYDKIYNLSDNDLIVIPSNAPHEAWFDEDTLEIDFFTPPREDWLEKKDDYLRKSQTEKS